MLRAHSSISADIMKNVVCSCIKYGSTIVCIKHVNTQFTNTGSVIILDIITWVAGTEVASNSVCTSLIASTVVKCTLVNVLNSIEKNRR